jgi:hypothetical protein
MVLRVAIAKQSDITFFHSPLTDTQVKDKKWLKCVTSDSHSVGLTVLREPLNFKASVW